MLAFQIHGFLRGFLRQGGPMLSIALFERPPKPSSPEFIPIQSNLGEGNLHLMGQASAPGQYVQYVHTECHQRGEKSG